MYNPFDILLLFRKREFNAGWFETAVPRSLVETLRKRRIGSMNLDGMRATRALLSAFDVEDIEPEALLFQTGYLTIAGERRRPDGPALFRLGYPNREVRESLNEYLLHSMIPPETRSRAPGFRLHEQHAANDFEGIEALLRAFFAAVPYEWRMKNEVARYEGSCASVFYSHVAASGLEVTVEDSSACGRAHMTVRSGGSIFRFDSKVVEQAPAGAANAQLKAKGYADKCRSGGEPTWLIGVEFSTEERNRSTSTVEAA